MTRTIEAVRGLEPMPEGTIVAMENPYNRTVYFERQTDWGPQPCEPPAGYKLKPGWALIERKE